MAVNDFYLKTIWKTVSLKIRLDSFGKPGIDTIIE